MRHDDPVPEEVGALRIQFIMGLGGGLWTDGGLGLILRASGQVARDVETGGDLAIAFNLENSEFNRQSGHPGLLVQARSFSRYNAGSLDWLGLEAGLGVGFTDRGLVYLTFDGGTLFGYGFGLAGEGKRADARALVYGGPVIAGSVPLARGTPIRSGMAQPQSAGNDGSAAANTSALVNPKATFFAGGTLGFGFESISAASFGSTFEAVMLWAQSADEEAILMSLSMGTGASSVVP